MDKVAVSEYQLQVIEGADTLSAKIKWNYDNVCNGKTIATYKRK